MIPSPNLPAAAVGQKALSIRQHLTDGLALAGLWLLILLAFWLIGPAGRVLANGDLFTYFYPYWAAAAQALGEGRLPLWNPYLFMGVPFLANSQVGLFYPLNWPLWLLLPPHRALHWSVILHLWLTATGAYVYGRAALRLGHLGAWTAGAALALGGYLGAQVEHVNQLQALAWLPWLLLIYDRAIEQQGRLAWPALAAVMGMTLLAGHAQSAFIALTGLAVYGLATPGPASPARRYGRPVGIWLLAVAVGLALAAAQLLPTFELATLSVRSGGLPFKERLSFSLSPLYLARALLPGYGQAVEPDHIEYVAALGVSGLLLAAGSVAHWLQAARRRADPPTGLPLWPGRHIVLPLVGLFLSLGLFNPVYLLLAWGVPGFAHFRAPARWLALWACGAALLVGWAVDAVAGGRVRLTRRMWVAGGSALALFLTWGALGGQADWTTILGWLAAAALAAALLWLAQMVRPQQTAPLAGWGLTALLVAELLLSARTLPHTRATAPQAYTSLRPAAAHLVAAGQGDQPADRFLSLSALVFDPGDLPELRLIYDNQLAPAALYDLVVSTKHREVLSPNLSLAFGVPAVDGYDGGVLPLARYVALQRAFLPPDEIALDGRLRENLTTVPDGRWLSLLNVRYVITDKVFDAWIDNVFYDLQFKATLAAGEQAEVARIPPLAATALGLVSYLEGAEALADGAAVGEVTVGFDNGAARTFTLRAGMETAEGLYDAEVAHAQATVGGHYWPGQPEGNDYVTRLRWDGAAVPTTVVVRALLPQGRLVVRGVSLLDERSGSFQALTLSDQGRFWLAHSGDVKVYENLDALPRAFVAQQAWVAASQEEALARMQAVDFDPLGEIVVEGTGAVALRGPVGSTAGPARITAYAPERVEVQVELAAPGYLVLTDSHYPGWRAWVDGEEAEVFVTDLLFRAVWLEEGQHRVVFTFEPRSVWMGGVISLVTLAALAIWAAISAYRSAADARRASPIVAAFER